MSKKIYFKYGAMNASKTLIAQGCAYNYIENGMTPLLINAGKIFGDVAISSRPGISLPAISSKELEEMRDDEIQDYSVVIIDRAEQLTTECIDKLVHIADDLDIPVICHGLRTDYKGNLFPATIELFRVADSIEEIKTICWCGSKATMSAKLDEDGTIIKDDSTAFGVRYVALCRNHYNQGITGRNNCLNSNYYTTEPEEDFVPLF